jgi:hypothetical protein
VRSEFELHQAKSIKVWHIGRAMQEIDVIVEARQSAKVLATIRKRAR